MCPVERAFRDGNRHRSEEQVTCLDGKQVSVLVEATPEDYRLKGSFKPAHQEGKSWAHPVVAGGRLYLREQDKLMCYNLRAEP